MQYSGTVLLLLVNACILNRNNYTARPIYVFIVWKEDASLPAMLNLLCRSTNQQLFKRTFVIKVATMKIMDDLMEAITCLPLNRRWTKMNGTQRRAMKNALYVQRYGKRHLSGWSDVEQQKNQARSLSHCWVMRVWRHQVVSYSSQSVENFVE